MVLFVIIFHFLKLKSENLILTVSTTSHFIFFKKGQTALHIAAAKHYYDTDVVTFLLNKDCDPNITNVEVSTSYQRIRIYKVTLTV